MEPGGATSPTPAAGALPEELRTQVKRARYEVRELVATARALSSERDIRKLLAMILEKSRQVTGADAGSVYILEEGEGGGIPSASSLPAERKRLRFMMSQNDSLPVDFKEYVLPVDGRSIVGKAVLDARPINIPDLHRLEEPGQNPWGFHHNRSIDERTGYRAGSMLTVPMLSARSEVIGVVQLINKKRAPRRKLATPADFDEQVVPFDERSEDLALALASQAGICIENAILYDEIRKLFEGFVDASVTAIEARDPTTSGHSRRVATLTVALAERVDALSDGPFGEIRFSRDELKQIEYAGVLHDFGKVGVRESVLVKAKKLYEWDRRAIEERFAYIKRTIELEAAERKLRLALGGEADPGRLRAEDDELRRRFGEVDGHLAFVLAANEPAVLDQGGFERLAELGLLRYRGASGEPHPYLTEAEIAALQVRRGSLTSPERIEIESHVSHTIRFLETIPWGRSFRAIPGIAGAHHEYLDGSGYPRRLEAGQIRIESRMMTIADIFDALTASDRPYKRAVPVPRAIEIIEKEVQAGKCDGDLFRVFVGGEIYKRAL